MKNMKLKIAIIVSLLFLISCKNTFDFTQNSKDKNSKVVCVLHGTIESGMTSSSDFRSAFSSAASVSGALYYDIRIKDSELVGKVSEDGKNFSIGLPEGFSVIQLKAFKDEDKTQKIFEGELTVNSNSIPSNPVILLKPVVSEGGKGNIKLPVCVQGTDIYVNYVKVIYDGGVLREFNTITRNQIFYFEVSDFASGSHKITFEFYDNELDNPSYLVYSTQQVVNVFDYLTTDTWINNTHQSCFSYLPGSSVLTLSVTQNVIKKFLSHAFYVDQDAADVSDANGSFYKPFNSINRALHVISRNNITDSCSIYLKSDVTTTTEDASGYLINCPSGSGSLNVTITSYDPDSKTSYTISADGKEKLLNVGSGNNVTLTNVFLTDGKAASGGCVEITGTLTLNKVSVLSCTGNAVYLNGLDYATTQVPVLIIENQSYVENLFINNDITTPGSVKVVEDISDYNDNVAGFYDTRYKLNLASYDKSFKIEFPEGVSDLGKCFFFDNSDYYIDNDGIFCKKNSGNAATVVHPVDVTSLPPLPESISSLTENTYVITSEKQLRALADYTGEGNSVANITFVLGKNIKLKSEWKPIGGGLGFNGQFDGNNYIVENLFIKSSENGDFGFFSYINHRTDNLVPVSVKNLTVKGSIEITGNVTTAGGISGSATRSEINNCISQVDIQSLGDQVGGITGLCENSVIINCINTGNLTANVWCGGIVGSPYGGVEVYNSANMGDITVEEDGAGLVYGDIVLKNSYSCGSVNASVAEACGALWYGYEYTDRNLSDLYYIYNENSTLKPLVYYDSTDKNSDYYKELNGTGICWSFKKNSESCSLSVPAQEKTDLVEALNVVAQQEGYNTWVYGNSGIFAGYPVFADTVARINQVGEEDTVIVLSTSSLYSNPEVLSGIPQEGKTYTVSSENDLVYLSTLCDKGHSCFKVNFIQNGEISLTKDLKPIGNQGCPFSGIYDGRNNSILNISFNDTNSTNVGLFGYVVNAKIQNLTVEGEITGKDAVGGFVGRSGGNVILDNCENQVVVSGSNCGGFIGYVTYINGNEIYSFSAENENTTIINCINNPNYTVTGVSAVTSAGGFIGYVATGVKITIQNCGNLGNIEAVNYAAGFIGTSKVPCTINNCWSFGTINVTGATSYKALCIGYINSNSASSKSFDISHCYYYWPDSGSQDFANNVIGKTDSGGNIATTNIYPFYLSGYEYSLNMDGTIVSFEADILNSWITAVKGDTEFNTYKKWQDDTYKLFDFVE